MSATAPGNQKIIRIVAALVMSNDGRTLLVRKRGTSAFMQPGGKLDSGEPPVAALRREIREELGCDIVPGSDRPLGCFSAPAANEAGATVEAQLYRVTLAGEASPLAEIEETIWVDPSSLPAVALAPLTERHVLPLARHMLNSGGVE